MRTNKLTVILIMTIMSLGAFSGAAWAGWTPGNGIITTTDKVGIGTDNPSTTLDVEGNLLLNDEVCSISSDLKNKYVHNYQATLNDDDNYGYVRGHYFKTILPAGKQVGDTNNARYIQGLYSTQIVEANSHLYGNSYGVYGLSYAHQDGVIHGNSISVYGQGAINPAGYVTGDLIGVYGDIETVNGQVDGKRWAGYFTGNTYIKGNLGIGTTSPDAKLAVNGTIKAREVRVTTSDWSDFVFDKGYKLPSLDKVESYINENKHLPDVPSAQDVQQDGINVSDMMAKQMQKIEELTLYMIELKKENEALKNDNQAIKERLSRLDSTQDSE